MAIERAQAFGAFEDLLRAGLHPVLSGHLATVTTGQWLPGDEAFFLRVGLEEPEPAGVTMRVLSVCGVIAAKHGLCAWFTGRSAHDEESGGITVSFERPSVLSRDGLPHSISEWKRVDQERGLRNPDTGEAR